jgi:hypothetical protein
MHRTFYKRQATSTAHEPEKKRLMATVQQKQGTVSGLDHS